MPHQYVSIKKNVNKQSHPNYKRTSLAAACYPWR